MILVVLAVVWVVALTPWVLRKLSERQVVTSVSSFHRQLLRLGSHTDRGSVSLPGATIGFSATAQRVREAAHRTAQASHSNHSDPVETEVVVPTVVVTSRSTAVRRRRVVASLVAAMAFFFLVGLVPGAHVMWDLALVCLAFAAAYVAALIHFHRRAVERAQKVVALETRRSAATALDQARLSRAGGGHVRPGAGRLGGSGWAVTGRHGRELAATGR